VSKHGVVTLSETLHRELGLLGTAVKVSVLCPGFVNTRILEADRNRPAALQNPTPALRHPTFEEMARAAISSGLPPREAAAQVIDAIKTGRFWVLTHPQFAPRVRERMEDILEARNPAVALSLG
jgi:NAD(P)-dependent dehydrogenase (short-subunit alcohol dehydrogenase family)